MTFDEGVFLASTDLAASGLTQYRDFFASQGPLFLPMLEVADVLGFGDPRAPRTVMIVAGIAIAIATYFIVATVTSRARSLGLAVLVSISGAVLHAAGPVQSEGPALAFALVALAVTLYRQDRTGALLAGVFIGAAVATKSLHVLPTVSMVAVVMAYRRSWLNLAYTSLAAMTVSLAGALAYGVERVWDQYILFHLAKDNSTNLLDNLAYMGRYLFENDTALAIVAVGSILLLARPARHSRIASRHDVPHWLPAAWFGASLVTLLGFTRIDPGFVRVMAFVIPPLAYSIAAWSRIPDRVLLGVAGVALVFQFVVIDYQLDTPDEVAAAVDVLEGLDEERLFVSDDPGILWSAGRLSHPDTVDPSFARFNTGYLTDDAIQSALLDPETCAFLSTSERFEANEIFPPELYQPAGPPGVFVREGC
ncbi:MAG: hypothetical protein DWQ40_12480 [Actinobacteria bacterium]|nr:MAG: hypothetical protein DWQ40_12480 [Actinomycetota bacterium]REK38770.1 MAG: hypothetical protein DWQ20_03420 [Actinomycetota bacterium]